METLASSGISFARPMIALITAELKSQQILTWLAQTQLHTNGWSGTQESFLTFYQDQVCLHDRSPGSSGTNGNGRTQSQESHGSHESKPNPDSNSGPMDRNQNEAPNESKQDFGEARQN
jgi:hypothetical protein